MLWSCSLARQSQRPAIYVSVFDPFINLFHASMRIHNAVFLQLLHRHLLLWCISWEALQEPKLQHYDWLVEWKVIFHNCISSLKSWDNYFIPILYACAIFNRLENYHSNYVFHDRIIHFGIAQGAVILLSLMFPLSHILCFKVIGFNLLNFYEDCDKLFEIEITLSMCILFENIINELNKYSKY